MNMKWIVSILLSFVVLSGMVTANAESLVSDTKTFRHHQSSGGSGVDSISLTAPRTPKSSCAVFVKAQVKYAKRHYGKVEITERPKAQCNPKKEQCKLGISWEHSPAGRLDYKVNITWLLKPC